MRLPLDQPRTGHRALFLQCSQAGISRHHALMQEIAELWNEQRAVATNVRHRQRSGQFATWQIAVDVTPGSVAGKVGANPSTASCAATYIPQCRPAQTLKPSTAP